MLGPQRLRPVAGLPSGIAAVAAGAFHTCAVTTAGGVQCWGDNGEGQLGNGSLADKHVPVAVSGLSSGVAAVAAGSAHTCAVTTAGAVQCWGSNSDGSLGNGSTTDSDVPVSVSGLSSGATTIAAGASHACAVIAGRAQCWGFDIFGQVGNGSTSAHVLVPVGVVEP